MMEEFIEYEEEPEDKRCFGHLFLLGNECRLCLVKRSCSRAYIKLSKKEKKKMSSIISF
jgi:hypothetical protein